MLYHRMCAWLTALLCVLCALCPAALAEEEDERPYVTVYLVTADVYEIPEGTTYLSDLYACTIGTLKLPASLTEWPGSISYSTVERYEADPDNPAFRTVDGVLYTKDMTELVAYPQTAAATSFTVPSGVKRIADYAFADNENLVSVSLPLGLREIGRCAFMRCMSLVSVSLPLTVTAVDEYAFTDCMFLERVSMSPQLKAALPSNAF